MNTYDIDTLIVQNKILIENKEKSVEILREIEAWLSFNQSPTKKELKLVKNSINNYLKCI